MKIIMNTRELVAATAVIGKVAVKESIIQFNMMKKQQGDKVFYAVTITAFDGKTQVASSLFAKSAEVDGNSVSFNMGYEVVGVIDAVSHECDDITVEINSQSVDIVAGNSRVTLKRKSEGLAPVAFDLVNRDAIEEFFELNTAELKDAVDRVAVAVDNNLTAVCPGICFTPMENGAMALRAVNGICLAQSVCQILSEQAKNRTGISTSSRLFKSVLATATGDMIRLYKTASHMIVQCKPQLWQLPLLDNTLPDKAFENVLAGSRPVRIECRKDNMLNAIAVVQAAGQDNKRMYFNMQEGKIVISNFDKSANTFITPDYMTGELEETIMNVHFLKAVLGMVKGNELVMSYCNSSSPISIEEKGNDKSIAIIVTVKDKERE